MLLEKSFTSTGYSQHRIQLFGFETHIIRIPINQNMLSTVAWVQNNDNEALSIKSGVSSHWNMTFNYYNALDMRLVRKYGYTTTLG